jgi:hypothetical protein
MVAKIATGEIEDTTQPENVGYHSRGGKKGGAARAAKLSPETRVAIAQKAAASRWKK